MELPSFVAGLLVALGVLTTLWFLLLPRLYRRLALAHPAIYESLGRPTLTSDDARSFLMSIEFILRRKHRFLSDARLSLLSDSILVLVVVHSLASIRLSAYVISSILQ